MHDTPCAAEPKALAVDTTHQDTTVPQQPISLGFPNICRNQDVLHRCLTSLCTTVGSHSASSNFNITSTKQEHSPNNKHLCGHHVSLCGGVYTLAHDLAKIKSTGTAVRLNMPAHALTCDHSITKASRLNHSPQLRKTSDGFLVSTWLKGHVHASGNHEKHRSDGSYATRQSRVHFISEAFQRSIASTDILISST